MSWNLVFILFTLPHFSYFFLLLLSSPLFSCLNNFRTTNFDESINEEGKFFFIYIFITSAHHAAVSRFRVCYMLMLGRNMEQVPSAEAYINSCVIVVSEGLNNFQNRCNTSRSLARFIIFRINSILSDAWIIIIILKISRWVSLKIYISLHSKSDILPTRHVYTSFFISHLFKLRKRAHFRRSPTDLVFYTFFWGHSLV